jgi:hypothetical protein
VVANAVAPAGKPHLLADVGCAQNAAGMGAIAVHVTPDPSCRAERHTRGLACQERESQDRATVEPPQQSVAEEGGARG